MMTKIQLLLYSSALPFATTKILTDFDPFFPHHSYPPIPNHGLQTPPHHLNIHPHPTHHPTNITISTPPPAPQFSITTPPFRPQHPPTTSQSHTIHPLLLDPINTLHNPPILPLNQATPTFLRVNLHLRPLQHPLPPYSLQTRLPPRFRPYRLPRLQKPPRHLRPPQDLRRQGPHRRGHPKVQRRAGKKGYTGRGWRPRVLGGWLHHREGSRSAR